MIRSAEFIRTKAPYHAWFLAVEDIHNSRLSLITLEYFPVAIIFLNYSPMPVAYQFLKFSSVSLRRDESTDNSGNKASPVNIEQCKEIVEFHDRFSGDKMYLKE